MQAELKQAALQTSGEITDENMDEPLPGQSSAIDYIQLDIDRTDFFQQRKSFQIFLLHFQDSFIIYARAKFFAWSVNCQWSVW